MFGLSKLVLDKCDKITTVSKDSTEATTKWVLYNKAGEEVILSAKTVKVADIDAKIAVLQAEKVEISNLTKEVVEQVEVK